MFMIPRIIRNDADTDVPIIFPTLENESNLREMASALAATTSEVITTILSGDKYESCNCRAQTNVECPNENQVPTVTGLIPPATSLLVIKSMADM